MSPIVISLMCLGIFTVLFGLGLLLSNWQMLKVSFLFGAGAVVLFLVSLITGINPNFSDGERTGVVTKLSHKGVIWKTNDGSMNMGVMSGMGAVETFEFIVIDPTVVEAVRSAAEKSEKTTLHYKEWLIGPIWYGGTGYIVDDIKVNGKWLKRDNVESDNRAGN